MEFWELMHEEYRDLVRERGLARQQNGTPPSRYEVKIRTKSGDTRWLDFTAAPIEHNGQPAVLGTAFDISDRKHAELELRRLSDELELRIEQRTAKLAETVVTLERQVAQRKRAEKQAQEHQATLARVLRMSTASEMAAGLAHELNQPLGAIANYANGAAARLRTGAGNADELLTAVHAIHSEAIRGGEIIRRLRDLVRGNDNKREATDINELVRASAELLTGEAREQSVEVIFELEPNTPHVVVDRIRIEQVVLNLLRNGLDAMAPGGSRTRRLIVRTRTTVKAYVEVSVQDFGVGLPHASIERIFDAFYTTKRDGLGMGLSISRSIITSHGGVITAANNHGDHGCILSFTLPEKE